ncbi:carbonic anhydrase [Xylariaceae sp. FL0255]|nr:carbonic anhydrase [Xylariaceae sp. FL0255]
MARLWSHRPDWAEMLEQNKNWQAANPNPYVKLTDAPQAGMTPPGVLIFSCIDPRASPEELLGLQGGEAFVVRNLGGRGAIGVKELVFLEHVTKGMALKEVIIMHHTDCGLTHADGDKILAGMKAEYPARVDEISKLLTFPTYDGSSVEKHMETIREDINFVKSLPYIRQELKDNVKGYLFDIETGKLIPAQ